jgi:hypothetical protein
MFAGGGGRPACKRTTLSQQVDAKKRTGFGAGRGQGEGRLKFLTLKNLDVIDLSVFFNTLTCIYPLAGCMYSFSN